MPAQQPAASEVTYAEAIARAFLTSACTVLLESDGEDVCNAVLNAIRNQIQAATDDDARPTSSTSTTVFCTTWSASVTPTLRQLFDAATPLSDAEATAFAGTRLDYGRYVGRNIADIPVDYLLSRDRFAVQNAEWLHRLRRYLLHLGARR